MLIVLTERDWLGTLEDSVLVERCEKGGGGTPGTVALTQFTTGVFTVTTVLLARASLLRFQKSRA